MEREKKQRTVLIILGIILTVAVITIMCLVLFFRKGAQKDNKSGDFITHTGLNLEGKYESYDENTSDSGSFIIRKYVIKDSEKDYIRQFISNNWPEGYKTALNSDKYPIWKQIMEDSDYCKEYYFMWTPDNGAKTSEIIVQVVDKPDGEMYIVY